MPAPRSYRTAHVHYPWAWSWWPTRDLITEDPDVTDHRRPRAISTAPADWKAVLQAVRYAVGCLPTSPEVLQQSSIEVELPMPLGALEYDLVASWVGAASPVIYWYEDDTIQDGRHRLWLTRPFVGDDPVPMVSNTMYYLQDALAGGVTATTMVDSLEEARLWWDHSPAANGHFYNNRDHRRYLSHAFLALTSPAPLPAAWFPHLHDWDQALPALVSLHQAGRVDERLLRAVFPRSWRGRQDSHGIDAELALELFRTMAGRRSGFTVNGRDAPRPNGQLRLFRGATHANRAGVSWTSSPTVAEDFARNRQALDERGTLWTALVPAERLLAFFPDENEYIVDLVGVEDIVDPAPASPKPGRITTWRTRRLQRRDERRVWCGPRK